MDTSPGPGDTAQAVIASRWRTTIAARPGIALGAEGTRAYRSASAEGLGAGLIAATAGLTLWGVLLLGVAAVEVGGLTRVTLAVLALTALAAFDAVAALPSAAVQMGQARASAARVSAVLDAPDPATPLPLPGGPLRVMLRDA